MKKNCKEISQTEIKVKNLIKRKDMSNLLKMDYNVKITETEDKLPSITGLVTTAALNIVENKIPNVSKLVKNKLYQTLNLNIYHI